MPMQRQVPRAERDLERLLALAARMARAPGAEAAAEAALATALEVLDAQSAAVALLTPDGLHLEVIAAAGERPPPRDTLSLHDPSCPLSTAVLERAPVWIETEAELSARYPVVPGEAVAALPLLLDGAPVGGLLFVFAAARRVPDGERRFLARLAELAAPALSRARAVEAERRLFRAHRALFVSAPVGVAYLDRDLRFGDVNRRMAGNIGLPAEALLGKHVDEVWRGAGEALGPKLEHVLASGEPIGSHPLEHADGSPRAGSVSIYPVRDEDGTILGLGVANLDLSALRTAEARLGLALAAARMIAWEWDARADALVYSGNAAEILGLPWDRTITRAADFLALVLPEDRGAHEDARRALRRGESFRATYRVVRPVDGAVIWIEQVGQGTCDEEGRVVRAQGVVLDVTARTQAEEKRAAAELGIQLKDEFLARVSHELRTPLAAMRMWVQVLRGGAVDDRRVAVDAIDKCSKAQSKLIDDLLDLARGMNGKLRITEEVFDVRGPIEEAVAVMRPEAEAKSILLLTAMATDAGHVRGDPGRVQQVIANLLSNAVKFTPAGGRVEVLARGEGRSVVVSVSDTGTGIDAGELEAVFVPFRQREGAAAHGGLGLGLAIARQLVDLHGGGIRAENRGDGGATFTVTLPRVPDEDVPPTPSQARRLRGAAPPLTGLRLLLVDDHAPTREGVACVLTSFGAEVTSCGSVAQAMDTLGRARPDVIISDLAMPEEDGYAFIRRVRALDGELGRTPAVALTAHARPEDAVRALTAGFQEHVAKPLDSQYLVDLVARLAGRAPGSTPAPPGRRPRRRAW